MAKKVILEAEVDTNIGEVTDDVKKLDDATAKGSKAFKGMRSAVQGVGTALKSLGIVAILAAAFTALKDALSRNQKVMNTVNTVMTTISTTFNQVAQVLIDVYTYVSEASDRFDGLGKVLSGIMTLALTPLKLSFYTIKLAIQGLMLAWENSFLGGGDEGRIKELRADIQATTTDLKEITEAAINAGKDIVNNIGDAISEVKAMGEIAIEGISKISIKANYEQAKATTAAQNSAKLAAAEVQGLIDKYGRQAELQKQIRDDERNTFADRKKAHEEISKIIEKQETEMLALVNTRVAAAKLEMDANATNIDLQVAYQQTLNERAAVLAEIATLQTAQQESEIALNKELFEVRKELAEGVVEGIEKELLELENAYKLKLEMARKSGANIEAITKKYEGAKTKIIEDNEREKLRAITGFASQVNALAGEQKGIAVATALMNTYLGVTEVMKDPTIISTSAKFVAAGTVLAAGLANVQNILSQDVGDGGGGSVGAAAQTPAPQMMSGAFTLGQGQEVQPMQAYVVSDDITNNQNKLAIIRRRATI